MSDKIGATVAGILLLVLALLGFVFFFFFEFSVTFAQSTNTEYPVHDAYVTDISGLLSSGVEQQLEVELASYEAATGTEIAVVIIPLIPDGMSANKYATGIGNSWGVGKAGVDNGAIFLIETDDVPGERDIYIAPGSQLEGGLTDIEAAAIVNEVVIPYFQNGEIDNGVITGVDAMIASLAGESFTDLRMSNGINGEDIEMWWNFIIYGIFFVLPWLGAVLGRSKAIWPGGVLGAGGGALTGWLALGGLYWIGLFAVILGIIGLIFDAAVSREYKAAKSIGRSPSWWAGGGRSSGGGSSFGGFGGGGFSGGGGGGRW